MQPPKLLRRLVFVVLAATLTCLPAASPGNDVLPPGVDLFEAAAPSPRPRAVAAEDTAVRTRRRVRVRRELLQAPAAVTAPLRFNLFPGAGFTGVPDRDERTADGDRVIAGTLAGVPGSSFLLVMHGEEVMADVFVSPLERYQLRREPGEDGAPEVRRLDPRALPPCAGTVPAIPQRSPGPTPVPRASVPHQPQESSRPHATGDSTDADDPGTFDVLIAYTPAARVAAGGIGAIEAQARFAVEGANQRYANSGITTQARLVRTLEVLYVEATGGVFEDLHHLIEDGTGPLVEMRAARDAAAADVACLFVASPSPRPQGGFFIGAATFAVDLGADGQPYGVPELGFSVVMPAYDVGTTFAHEVGHNFGCQHDIENVVFQDVNYGPGIFPFSYGYRFTVPGGQQFRDVMAYEPGVVIPYFSNPQVLYSGVPTGTASADNARTINATAPLVANLRRMPHVSIVASEPWAFESQQQSGRFVIRRSGPVDRALTVNLKTASYTYDPYPSASYHTSRLPFATVGVDYAPTLPEQIVIPAGSDSVTLDVVPVNEGYPELPERVTLVLQDGAGYALVSPTPGTVINTASLATVTIRDTATTVSVLASTPVAIREPFQAGRFTVTRAGSLDAPLTIVCVDDPTPLSVQLSGPDYTVDGLPSSSSHSLTFPAGVASLDLTIQPTLPAPAPSPTSIYQGPHSVVLRLVESNDAVALVPSAQIQILDRPGAAPLLPSLAITASTPQGSIFTQSAAEFTVVRTGPLETQVPVDLSIRGTAVRSIDYEGRAISGSGHVVSNAMPTDLLIPAGENTVRIYVFPLSLPADTRTKSVVVTLNPSRFGAHTVDLAHASATVTLLGTPVVTATVTGPEARATSDLGPVNGEFTLRREGDLFQPLTVRYNAAGTAVAGNRCKVLPGVATFPAGLDFVRVKVKPKGNAGGPGAKTNVKLTLQPGDGYFVGSEARAKVKVFGGG